MNDNKVFLIVVLSVISFFVACIAITLIGFFLYKSSNSAPMSIVTPLPYNFSGPNVVYLNPDEVIPTSGDGRIVLAELVGNDLHISAEYTGCDTPSFTLFAQQNIAVSSYPPMISMFLYTPQRTGYTCEMLGRAELSFNLSDLSLVTGFTEARLLLSDYAFTELSLDFPSQSADQTSVCYDQIEEFNNAVSSYDSHPAGVNASICDGLTEETDFSTLTPLYGVAKYSGKGSLGGYMFSSASRQIEMFLPSYSGYDNSDFTIGQYYMIDMMNICRQALYEQLPKDPEKLASTFVVPSGTECKIYPVE